MRTSPPKDLKEALQITREMQVETNDELNYSLAQYQDIRITAKDADRLGYRYDAAVAEATKLTTLEIKEYIVKTYHENPAVAIWGPLVTMIDVQFNDLFKILLTRYRNAVDRNIN